MENVILILMLLAILGGAVWYVIRAKKKGKACIGCPGNCEGCSGGCGIK